jgi:hypothetical protein
MSTESEIDLGVMVEGVIELDPMSGRLVVRYEMREGSFGFLDVEERLRQYKDQEVRCILTPMATVQKIAAMVQKGEMRIEDVPLVPKLE